MIFLDARMMCMRVVQVRRVLKMNLDQGGEAERYIPGCGAVFVFIFPRRIRAPYTHT